MSSFSNGLAETNPERVRNPNEDLKIVENVLQHEADDRFTENQNNDGENPPNDNTTKRAQLCKPNAKHQPSIENLNIKLWKDYSNYTKINHGDPKRNGDFFCKKFMRNEIHLDRQEDRKVRSMVQESKPAQLSLQNSTILRRESGNQRPTHSPSRFNEHYSIERLKPLPNIDFIKSEKFIGKMDSAPEHIRAKKSSRPAQYPLSYFLNQPKSQRNGSSDNQRTVFERMKDVNLILSKPSFEKEAPRTRELLHRGSLNQPTKRSFLNPENSATEFQTKQTN